MKFNSQICTTKEQSERLLAFGLKKETADMYLLIDHFGNYQPATLCDFMFSKDQTTPAWSLHRLLCLTNPYLSIDPFGNIEIGGEPFSDIYEGLISTIEYYIRGGYFNKDYLEE